MIILGESRRRELGLPEPIEDALAEYAKIKSHNARRRQERRLAALLRNEDCDEMVAALDSIDGVKRDEAKIFQQVERWRMNLLSNVGAEEAFSKEQGLDAVNREELLALTAKARKEEEFGRPKGAGKALFRFLRRFAA